MLQCKNVTKKYMKMTAVMVFPSTSCLAEYTLCSALTEAVKQL